MSVEYAAAIMVGRSRKDFPDEDQLEAWIEGDELNVCAPWYDGDDADCAIAGIQVAGTPSHVPSELDIQGISCEISVARQAFTKLTGMEAKVYLSPRGW